MVHTCCTHAHDMQERKSMKEEAPKEKNNTKEEKHLVGISGGRIRTQNLFELALSEKILIQL